ncbi:MAG TPA: hypothetical protein VF173_05655 [Thermoanaerobaculia bacterium]|nr:hypothetical protein [Thermoanaerobaculia bacterium]
MKSRAEVWRQHPWIWVPALLFFLANAVAFSVYKLGYAGQVEKLDDDLHAQVQKSRELNGKKQQLATMIARVGTNQEQVQQLYGGRLSTRSRRLTGITKEVKEMAKQAGLVPRAFSYPEEEIQDYGLIKRSFVFSVQGSYPALRKLVHLIEASHSFVTLQEIGLSSNAEGPELQISLTLSTLFAMTGEDGGAAVPAAPTARPAAPRPPPSKAGGDV